VPEDTKQNFSYSDILASNFDLQLITRFKFFLLIKNWRENSNAMIEVLETPLT
jgi:hypothetical protein